MNDEQITALAREYAEEILNDESYLVLPTNLLNNLHQKTAEYAEHLIRFLLRRYCIVEKDTVRETLYKLTDKFLEDNDHKAFGAASAAIESLFPEIAKEVDG